VHRTLIAEPSCVPAHLPTARSISVLTSTVPAGRTQRVQHVPVGSNGSQTTVALDVLRSYGVTFLAFDCFGNVSEISGAAESQVGSTALRQIALASRSVAVRLLSGASLHCSTESDPHGIGFVAAGARITVHRLPAGDAKCAAIAIIAAVSAARPPSEDPVPGLTAREREVALLIAGGASAKVIAHALGVSVHTVSRHTERIYAKAGVGTRTQLALRLHGHSGRAGAGMGTTSYGADRDGASDCAQTMINNAATDGT
jgi:DNA-binding CsgD family transcriptional regulator